VAGVFEVLRQHGADPAPHAPVAAQAKLVGQEGKPESYYFPPQHNNVGNNFPYTFMGLEPGTTKAQVRRASRTGTRATTASSTSPGLPPEARHRLADSAVHPARAGLALHLRAAVGQRRVRHVPVAGRRPRRAVALLVKDMPKSKHQDLDFIVDQLDWEEHSTRISRTTTTSNPSRSPTRAARATSIAGSSTARWTANSYFTAKELTVDPARKHIKDGGAYGLICVQGKGKINNLSRLSAPSSSASTN
jgi:hypothetical protein